MLAAVRHRWKTGRTDLTHKGKCVLCGAKWPLDGEQRRITLLFPSVLWSFVNDCEGSKALSCGADCHLQLNKVIAKWHRSTEPVNHPAWCKAGAGIDGFKANFL